MKIVVTIMPYKKMKRATAEMENKTYVVLGSDNVHALNNLFELLADNLK